MKRKRVIVISLVGAIVLVLPATSSANRNLAIVIDTSRSMQENDPRRYTMQLAQVLSDLVDDRDELAVIRMPPDMFFFPCAGRADGSLVLELDPANRGQFKSQLDGLLRFDTGTYFAAPIRTGISILSRDTSAQRMLLVIADSGGLGSCESALTSEMLAFKGEGATIAAINIGSSSGAFDRNPAFDFTTAALDAQGLIEAVALVYQRFLGAKTVQTGRVQGSISVEIGPYVEEAFLVVASDGPISGIVQEPGNPGAKSIDLNHRGGGSTQGLDGIVRSYRIVRLERPAPGTWRFRGVGLSDRAGWMLLQDSAIGVRLVSPPTFAKGVPVSIEAELFDRGTGRRIADTSMLTGLELELDVNGTNVVLRDDGTAGDRAAGDGVFTATTTFDRTGHQSLSVHVQSDQLDRRETFTAKVIEASWRLDVRTPRTGEVDRAVPLSVTLKPVGAAAPLKPLEQVDAHVEGTVVPLRDDGTHGDEQSGDNTLGGLWTPSRPGKFDVDYVPPKESAAVGVRAPVEVSGRLTFGSAVPVRLGRLRSKSEASSRLDLSTAEVRGDFELKITSPFHRQRSALEIDLGTGWVALSEEPLAFRLSGQGRRTWPLRIRTGECPEAHAADRPFELVISGTGPAGQAVRTTVPVTVEIVADSWLHCWWPAILLAAGLAIAGIVVHGFWSPSRFPPRLSVLLSPEEDIAEGFAHPIRAERGSGSGFYRDARIYICQDFRLSSRPRNAIALLRADRRLVRIEPVSGSAVWRQTADGAWEEIPADESTVRFGDLYRNDSSSLFFELRNS